MNYILPRVTHSSILAGKSHGRGAWQTTAHGVAEESDTTEGLNNNKSDYNLSPAEQDQTRVYSTARAACWNMRTPESHFRL